MPPMHGNFDRITVHFLFAEKPCVSMVSGNRRHNRARPGVISGTGSVYSVFCGVPRYNFDCGATGNNAPVVTLTEPLGNFYSRCNFVFPVVTISVHFSIRPYYLKGILIVR